jgi:hypothetical protein
MSELTPPFRFTSELLSDEVKWPCSDQTKFKEVQDDPPTPIISASISHTHKLHVYMHARDLTRCCTYIHVAAVFDFFMYVPIHRITE